MHLFNPWHDLALAHFTPNYTPPASAVQMTKDLAVLPVWYAGGDTVIAEGMVNRMFVDEWKEVLPVSSPLISFPEIVLHPQEAVVPWGWNPALRKQMLALGAAGSQVPTLEELLRLRGYAHRQHAVQLLRELKAEEPGYCGESHYFTRMEELLAFLSSSPGDKVLKMPLSGSGKGLVWILGSITDKQADWCRRVMRQQGGVIAEPVLRKVQDCAMEFYLDQGSCRFAGYSLFHAATSGAYTGNALLSDRRIIEKLSLFYPAIGWQRLRDSLISKLARLFPLYRGYAGVDMMICEAGGGYAVQPCVEINMRMNMGMVARRFHDQFMATDAQGRFAVDYFRKPGDAWSFHRRMEQAYPLVVAENRITSGYLPLTPVTADTRYTACIVVDQPPVVGER